MKKAKKLYCKKTISIVFCILLVLLTSCGTKANPKTATYGNFTDISFYDAFKYYFEDWKKLFGNESDYELNVEKGWSASDNLNEKALNNGEIAITYSLKFTIAGTPKSIFSIKFFMVLDETDNTLRARGAFSDANGIFIGELSKSEAEEKIIELYDHIEKAGK